MNNVTNAVVTSSAVSGMEWRQLQTVTFPSVNAPICGTAGCIPYVGDVLHHAAVVKSYERAHKWIRALCVCVCVCVCV